MNSNTRKKIESVVLSNMGVTEEEFKSWKIKDYSCDGICSTYIMSRFLEKMTGSAPLCHLPGRMSDGYGLKEKQITLR